MDEHTLNDLLECSVCLERLDTSSKVLPCQHTFCRKCLEIIVASHNELRCPECRVLIEIKIDDLPPNVLLMRILGGIKSAAQSTAGPVVPSQSSAQSKSSISVSNQLTTGQSVTESSPALPPAQGQSKSPQIIVNYRSPLQQQSQSSSNSKRIPNSISIPHARALFDFSAKENGDVNFKKGDHIILRKRLDANWLVGEVHGVEGVLPANHVQVVVPLPQPQCKALYDFRMGPNEEEGCLRFKKGSIIHVFRRVDQNWAEGRFGDCIGIFPIAFVEMNSLAKQIMENGGTLAPSVAIARVAPALPTLSNDSSNSSSDSSSTLTNSTCSNSSSSTSSTPTSPLNAPVVIRQSVAGARASNEHKRHSFNVLTNVHHSDPTILSNLLQHSNRHSAEILCASDQPPETAFTPQASDSSASVQPENKSRVQTPRSHPAATLPESLSKAAAGRASSARVSKLVDLQALPANYVALYPYKPKKSDELELKKGAVYNVTERCQDGWFKGTSRSNKCGVFPGNYVALLRNNRDHNKLLNLKRQGNLSTTSAGSASGHSTQSSLGSSKNNASGSTAPKDSASADGQVPPPELPPRGSTATSSSSKSVWIKSLGLNVECFFSPKADHSKTDATGESLSERLKNIKLGQTSTNPAAFSMDNPVFEDCSVGSASGTSGTVMPKRTSQLNHVHVRSGSCPSQLLQNLPQDSKHNPLDSQHLKDEFRINMNRNRPRTGGDSVRSRIADSSSNSSVHLHPLHNHSRFMANPNQSASSSHSMSSSHHRKSQSLDATAIASQLSHQAAKYNKSQHSNAPKERFRCIVPYPPNSEYELELQIDDIVFVHKKRDNGWYKGSHSRTGKIGLFPASFVQRDG